MGPDEKSSPRPAGHVHLITSNRATNRSATFAKSAPEAAPGPILVVDNNEIDCVSGGRSLARNFRPASEF